MGYHQAGFTEIVGVDIRPMPRYPFQCVQGDAIQFARSHADEFDAIHASPPCQLYSAMNRLHKSKHPDLIGATRDALMATGKPYVIENVVGAPLVTPIMLCGVMFGLRVFRHRLFESNVFLLAPFHPGHRHFGRCTPQGRVVTDARPYITVTGNYSSQAYARRAMGIDWMTRSELSQAIPPAFTEFVGRQLIEHVKVQKEVTA